MLRRSQLKTRTPLRRRTKLRAHTRINQKREKPRRGPPRNIAYRRFINTLPCCGTDLPHRCEGASEASHTGLDKGVAMKASDYSCVPKCNDLHTQWEQHKGVFASWSKEQRQAWAAPIIARCLALWAARAERTP